jgi:hypothetical protein
MYIAVQVHFISNTVHIGQIYTRLVAGQSWWINRAIALSASLRPQKVLKQKRSIFFLLPRLVH